MSKSPSPPSTVTPAPNSSLIKPIKAATPPPRHRISPPFFLLQCAEEGNTVLRSLRFPIRFMNDDELCARKRKVRGCKIRKKRKKKWEMEFGSWRWVLSKVRSLDVSFGEGNDLDVNVDRFLEMRRELSMRIYYSWILGT